MGTLTIHSTAWTGAAYSDCQFGGNTELLQHTGVAFLTPIDGVVVGEVKVFMKKNNSPTTTVYCAIWDAENDDEWKPGSELGVVTVDTSGVGASYSEVTIDLSGQNITLSKNTKYWLIFYTNVYDGSDYWHLRAVENTNAPFAMGYGVSNVWSRCRGNGSAWYTSSSYYFQCQISATKASYQTIVGWNGDQDPANYKGIFWEDGSSEQGVLQKFRTPSASGKWQVHGLSAHLQIDDDEYYRQVRFNFFEYSDTTDFSELIPVGDGGVFGVKDFYCGSVTPGTTSALEIKEKRKPILEPDTDYYLGITANFSNRAYALFDDTTCCENASLFTIGWDNSITENVGENISLFNIHGTEVAIDPEYTQDPILFSPLWPNPGGGYENIGYAAGNKYFAVAFTTNISNCTLKEIRATLVKHYRPISTPLHLKIHAADSTSGEIGDELLDIGEIEDYVHITGTEAVIPCGSTLELTPYIKYWAVFYFDGTPTTDRYYRIYGDGDLFGMGMIGVLPDDDSKCSAYSADGSSWTYESDYYHIRFIGSSEYKITILDPRCDRFFPSPNDRQRSFYDNTDKYVAQKIRIPNISEAMKIEGLGVIARAYGEAEGNVWVEIYEADGDALGELISNGTSDTLDHNATHTDTDTGQFPPMVLFRFSDLPLVQPNTDYIFVFRADVIDTGSTWYFYYNHNSDSASYANQGLCEGDGATNIIGKSYTVNSSDELTELSDTGGMFYGLQLVGGPPVLIPVDNDNVLNWSLNDYIFKDNITRFTITDQKIDQDNIILFNIAPFLYQDFILNWPLTTRINQDTTLRWPLTTYVEGDLIIPWNIIVSADSGLSWKILEQINKDQILNWPLTTYFDSDFILRWQLILSNDIGINFSLLEYIWRNLGLKIPIVIETDTVLDFGIMGPISADFIIRNMIDSSVYSDVGIKNNIFVTNDLILNNSLNPVVSRDLILRNEISSRIWKDIVAINNIFVSTDVGLINSLRSPINKDIIAKYNIDSSIWSDVVLRNAVFVSNDIAVVNSLNDVIDKDIIARWKIDSQVANDIGIKYAIRIEQDVVLVIPFNTVNKDIILDNKLMQETSKDTIIRNNILEYDPVQKDLIVRNALLGSVRRYKIKFV